MDLFDGEGSHLYSELDLPPEDRPFGTPVAIAKFGSVGVIVGSPRPGVWYERIEGDWQRRGTPLFPDVNPPQEEVTGPNEVTITPSQVTSGAIATMGDSIVLQTYMTFQTPFSWDDPPRPDEIESVLAIFTRGGAPLGSISLPKPTSYLRLAVVPESDRLLFYTSEPFPQVVEYSLLAHPSGS